ncbi:L-lysine exporter [Actinotalea sp.]|uniref:L-lysine exporter n=1 Tax=Actinotalea sp. TaxID=1872145 RepID=UPI002CB1BC00|nr:L-lysine exporter [Actinotalea sp.]HQY33736.1 L-lysine exporter [Actinotalea sp.]HRA51242.1 L-lysine exporter [Actinotalea sp.]
MAATAVTVLTTAPALTALAGFGAGLSLIVAIGAQNAFVLRQGIRREHVAAVVAVCALADALLIAAGVAGLGALVGGSPVALDVVRWAGATFLLVLAVGALRRARRPEHLDPADRAPARLGPVVLTTLGLTFLNPHVYLDTVVLLGGLSSQYGDEGRWLFGAGAVAASVVWFTALGFGARRLAPLFARPRAWQVLDLLVAVVMAAIALSLLL